ncbi:thioredoxin-like 1-1, chloroplastic [Quercus lobata]|uniref:Thioredoxin domain-containing protein n=1 Tax=Quercus lobata TaxID=97700 RepID=A0A7N2R7Q0_QUELO|nr:thioredoxin-like 1-1, chloroplastic [Quercus lobata]XP_030927323.1 thioredoxin-like 1-1, chloroplastic [Quercus lobata]
MMEVLSKTNLFSSCHHSQQDGFSVVFPKSRNYKSSSSVRWFQPLKLKSQALRSSSDFYGKRIVLQENKALPKRGNFRFQSSIKAQTGYRIGKIQKWWEKGLQPNMKEVTSAQELVDSLLNAGDKLLVVDFFSPGCGGCKALHPKICQFAEMNPDVQFIQVNYEEHKSMCYSLNVHVLPFFRFYRGAHGRLCSFSCTNATIKKFKDALAKHTPDRCSLGPTKGLEEKELLALSANKDLSFNYTPKPVQPPPVPQHEEIIPETAPSHSNSDPLLLSLPSTILKSAQDVEDKTLVTAGR